MLTLALLIVFPALMAFAAASDLFTMTISNRVSLLVIGTFFVFAVAAGLAPLEIAWHVAAGALVLLATFGCFAAGWIGGGDAKLAAATALWFGFAHTLDYLLVAAVLGGGLTLLILNLRQWPLPARVASWDWLQRLHAQKSGVPYGIALSASALLLYPYSRVWELALGL